MGSPFVVGSLVDPGTGGWGGVGEGWVSIVFGVTDASCWVLCVGAGFGRVVSSSWCCGAVFVVVRVVPSFQASVVCVGSGCGVSFPAVSGVTSSAVGVVVCVGVVVQLVVGFVHNPQLLF